MRRRTDLTSPVALLGIYHRALQFVEPPAWHTEEQLERIGWKDGSAEVERLKYLNGAILSPDEAEVLADECGWRIDEGVRRGDRCAGLMELRDAGESSSSDESSDNGDSNDTAHEHGCSASEESSGEDEIANGIRLM